MKRTLAIIFLLYVFLSHNLSSAEPNRVFFAVVDSTNRPITEFVELTAKGLSIYRLNSTHLYAIIGESRTVALIVKSWGVVVYSGEVLVKPNSTYIVRVPVADLRINAPPGARITITVLRSNESKTISGSGVIRALPLGLIRVKVEYGGRVWEEVYDFTGGTLNVYENLNLAFSPLSLALLALSIAPTALYLAALKVKEIGERRIPRPRKFKSRDVRRGLPREKSEKRTRVRERNRSKLRPENIQLLGKGGGTREEKKLGERLLAGFNYDDLTLREILERVRA